VGGGAGKNLWQGAAQKTVDGGRLFSQSRPPWLARSAGSALFALRLDGLTAICDVSDISEVGPNRLPLMILIGGGLTASARHRGRLVLLHPKIHTRWLSALQTGFFSHATHVDQLGMDCRYCHSAVEKSWFSNIRPVPRA